MFPFESNPNTVRGIAELSGSIALFAPPSDNFSVKGHDANALSAFGNVDNIIAINEKVVWRTEGLSTRLDIHRCYLKI